MGICEISLICEISHKLRPLVGEEDSWGTDHKQKASICIDPHAGNDLQQYADVHQTTDILNQANSQSLFQLTPLVSQ